MTYGTELYEYENANHNDEWYEHNDGHAGRGKCRTCAHNGCCVDLPHCGGLRWESALDDDEEEEESEEEEDGDGDNGDNGEDGEDGDDV